MSTIACQLASVSTESAVQKMCRKKVVSSSGMGPGLREPAGVDSGEVNPISQRRFVLLLLLSFTRCFSNIQSKVE